MDLVPCDETARHLLANSLFEINDDGLVNKKSADYVARTFPSILLDIARYLTEQATESARTQTDPLVVVRHQLKPYLMFQLLLGKCPQITGLMYNYFENSSFQPLPESIFQFDSVEKKITYSHAGFSDQLVKEILLSYFKYLAFNPKWFSSVWNWSELGRFITMHTDEDIRYIAACCLSVITRPTRPQHMSVMRDVIGPDNYQALIDLQIKHRHIFDNTFKPCLETKREMAVQYARAVGYSSSGYSYCPESIAKVANILLLKRDISLNIESQDGLQRKLETAISSYVPVATFTDTISRIAYSISINRPCLLKGPCGSGKSAILDYIAAHTNRLNPPDYVKVQVGDQIDSKLLVGSYVSTEIPGQFEWQPGPLTKAMAYGSWIVFDDIDSAPSEMAQVIHSVIENGNLSCVSCCPIKLDSPHPDFRIFFTQRAKQSEEPDTFKLGFGFVERLCDIVELPELTDSDLSEILQAKYKFGSLTSTILQLYRTAEKSIKDCAPNRSYRTISLRDLFKFCDRLASRTIRSSAEKFSSSDLDAAYLDAIDCFLSSLPKKDLESCAESLGQIVNLPMNEVQRLVFHRKPEIGVGISALTIGRANLKAKSRSSDSTQRPQPMAYAKPTVQLMESVGVCIGNREPVLLVGETGVGKTSIIQHLADLMRTELIVINLSQQSDSSDLLGGYKPVEMSEMMRPLHERFEDLFQKTFDANSNQTFLKHVNNLFLSARNNSQWATYLMLVCRLTLKALDKPLTKSTLDNWTGMHNRARNLLKRISKDSEASMALTFSQGALLRAVKEGDWILLDEINLAEPDVLQCLLLILDSVKNSHVYMNNPSNADEPISIHPNFRIFACMNPSTDIGKRDLPAGARGRFSEFFVDEVTDQADLRLIVESYVKSCFKPPQIERIVNFYREILLRTQFLSDTSGNIPVYSLRTLCRALSVCASNVCRNMEKSLFESLKITFLQQLNESSIIQVLKLMEQVVFEAGVIRGLEDVTIMKPSDDHNYVQVEGFWIQQSNEEPATDEKYIVTKSVTRNLQSLSRILSLGQRKLPILIQGNTSVGKTSLIMYLAKLTGNRCYRINNHEHTDIQEYVGRYFMNENGELAYQDGLLVRAMKKGYWIILDELNLAPCELLEALNRVLDDNRELFIPGTRETVKAHAKFALFATQNPPEEYAGRKLLSRAFRNRFIELHFDDIPGSELEFILHKRCEMAPQYAKKIVTVMKELQLFRRESGCFNGKNGFMTMRDLFRWGERYADFKSKFSDTEFYDWDMHIAREGLLLLEGRVRTINEADTVKSIIEKVFKRKLDRDLIYGEETYPRSRFPHQFRHIYFSKEFRRLFVQLTRALKHKEPVLLCGLTGCGKTTACQLYAGMNDQDIITYNCHLNTESSDFVGGVRPTRLEETVNSSAKQTFPWVNGPLINAMKTGAIFLMDEISLADDAVLERINSVLEPSRSITLTEKDGEEIFANERFRLVATMNPGGDYGKKELSPALRNRFTEIYCHNTTDIEQIRKIIEYSLSPPLLQPKIAPEILSIMKAFFGEHFRGHDVISIRDIISWCKFLNVTTCVTQPRPLSIQEAILNGTSLVFFDQFGTCGYKTMLASGHVKDSLRANLRKSVEARFGRSPQNPAPVPEFFTVEQDIVKFKKFHLPKGPLPIYNIQNEFVLDAPMVRKNLMKIVRAMQLDRPILLEGDPGAGKTSVVSALAKLTGHKLVRINLSEQTDISDLFGSDLPDTSNSNDDDAPRFCWHDGPMLRAIKDSQWILLDEMNLASQSVLEGLNACFDHRGEIFIPELNKRISVDRTSSRIFACQNPYSQGAARKGLPQSFLNRFTSIYIESHSPKDLTMIVERLYPGIPVDVVAKMVEFNNQVSSLYQHTGYEFNLRDIMYWCDLLTKYVRGEKFRELNLYRPDRFAQFVYLDRMRTATDRVEISELFEKVFGFPVYEPPYRDIRMGEYSFMMARSILPRKTRLPPHLSELCILKYQMPYIESIAKAIEHKKMPIIVGESGVGKRSMIRIIAGLTGNVLNIIGANREMDTIELLGSFEQKSFQREIVELVEESRNCVTAMINSISQKPYARTWSQLFSHIWATLYATSIRDLKLSKSETMDAFRVQLSQMKELIEKIQPLTSNQTEAACHQLNSKIDRLTRKTFYNSDSMYSSGNFEWIDSILIRSMREGSWLMIENANLLNPATLDRLNSLVEPNGSLSLNEKGSGLDGIETLVPHPDFRLILTMSPEFGELSRAMRNRGVEVYVQSRFYFEDFLMLLNQNGFEPEEQKACMTYCIMQTSYDAHKKITGEEPEEDGSLLAYFALNFISTLTHQIRRGMDVDRMLSDLLISYYKRKGFIEDGAEEGLRSFIIEQMNEYRKTYEVNLIDERYKWRHLRHDLVSLTGGDAVTAMLDRDNRIFYDDFNISLLLKQEEMLDNIDIVNTCITVKIFLELSTHGDFEYRKGFIRETFINYPNMMNTVNSHVDLLHSEYIPLINSLLPRSDLTPVSEMHVDSRNSPDIHYYLQSLDYEGTLKQEGLQNRWLLALHRIMLRMIVELSEERSMEIPGNTSLWTLSEKVRSGEMLKEDLVRPNAEIVSDLFELLDGLLRVVSNRCFDNTAVSKMLPRLFWISYFIFKLRRGYSKDELVSICNQLPMLWSLTYQKVIVPIIKDCNMADLNYKNKKFSHRLQHICDFLDITLNKPGHVEKAYYRKIVNSFASTTKFNEVFMREVDKFFGMLLGRYTNRSQALSLGADNNATLAASGLIWSNSRYMTSFYEIEDTLVILEMNDQQGPTPESGANMQQTLDQAKIEYQAYEDWLNNERYRSKCLNTNRRRNALDQFAPVWQLKFVQARLAEFLPNISDPVRYHDLLCRLLKGVNGITLSPKYYATLIKCLEVLTRRKTLMESSDDTLIDATRTIRQDVDIYTALLANHLQENIVLENQVVGWTKMRVTTSDLPSLAPLVPEYSPLVSLVCSYCLDISHLKLNSYLKSSAQLDSMLVYLWRSYVPMKLDSHNDLQDLDLARKLMHLRSKLGMQEELVGSYQCGGADNCRCVEEYIARRVPTYRQLMKLMSEKLDSEDVEVISKSIKLVYFGHLNLLEYAPMFTLDPSLRSREKLGVYRAELAHVKLDLQFRNTLFYWKTGENLQLNEVDVDEAALYPFSIRVLVGRRVKLEKSIEKLSREHINRPTSDDGSIYYELRKEIEVNINRYTNNIHSFMNDLVGYARCGLKSKSAKFNHLITRCRMLIKTLDKSVSRLRSDYSLYGDLLTNFMVGMCFVHQGLRCLHARLDQKRQILELGFTGTTQKYLADINRVFSFNNFTQGTMESVFNKLEFFPRLDKICPEDRSSHIQSVLLRTILIQLNHHITITPSDIEKCIPIVRNIADLFHATWLKRKLYLEEQRKQKEELYHYKSSRTVLGQEISYERQEFLDICSKFPTYDHVYQSDISMLLTSADKENLETEEKMTNLTRSVDLSKCIDICKAHYKFINEASRNLLGQAADSSELGKLPKIDLGQMIKLEAETLYTIIRHCIPTLDRTFDSLSLECHLLQANQLNKTLRQAHKNDLPLGTLTNSIDILDEDVFDIYHDANAYEALKFQEFIFKVDTKIVNLRNLQTKNYETHPTLHAIQQLMTRISSFLITDPLMKFVTGSHTLLEKLEEWNQQSISRDDKFIQEVDELIELIKSWRAIEIESWRSSLHQVKKKYIDNTLCDLWFRLYEAFNNPIVWVRNLLRDRMGDESFVLDDEELLYQGFSLFIKEFLEDSTLGDYQIRLDLVFSFAIQTRFASLYEQAQPNYAKTVLKAEKTLKVDFEKLNTYVYNTYRQYQGLFEVLKEIVEFEESQLSKELSTEIRIVAWQGRNLWEIKNNFRVSHRKLNKVMNKYLEVLRRPLPGLRASGNSSEIHPTDSLKELGSEQASLTLVGIQLLIGNVVPPSIESINVKSLQKSPKIVEKLKELYCSVYEPMAARYIDKLSAIESSISANAEAIENFRSHKVQGVVIKSTDSKESRAEKQKLCRQMYHSKKFAMQSIFKNLQHLGVSYQRGLNSRDHLDRQILSLEPLRGMIQTQSQSVLKAASRLVDDKIVIACNDQYRKLIAGNMLLLGQPCGEDLDSDQMNRIRGCALDMVIDILKHNRSAASIYRHLMHIQAATTRLTQLHSASNSDKIVIYNFSKIHTTLQQFNELVGRAYLALFKLEELTECCVAASDLERRDDEELSAVFGPDFSKPRKELSVLKDLISEIGEENSLMTCKQTDHIKSNLLGARKSIAEVSSHLRDMLNYTIRNHLYSDDDLRRLDSLYDQFTGAFRKLLCNDDNDEQANTKPGTALGSLRSILEEAEQKLKPLLERNASPSEQVTNIDNHPNLVRLNMRLHKLIRQAKLAAQGIYQEELSQNNSPKHLSEAAKRKLKPFNYIDSSTVRNLLRLDQVAKHTGNCFVTLNREELITDIKPIVTGLTPILFIYTQDVACYLNIILTSLHLKLSAANQLIPFFTDLIANGFGLPYKVDEAQGTEDMRGKASEDNAGFGEGQGDTDVSKKLEFESQLDDLKKDEQPGSEDKEKDDQPVEAHDDGVEMSHDLDSKAEGADNSQNGEENREAEEEEDEDQNELNDLEKELDTVDKDEGRLDEKLWGENDDEEQLGEDDEEDLREAENLDQSCKPKKEELEVCAKDEKLTDSKVDDDTKPATKSEEQEAPAELPEDPTNKIDKVPEANEEGENEELDLDNEAAQALKGTPNDTEQQEQNETRETESDQVDLVDMSISDEDDNPDKTEKPMEEQQTDKNEGDDAKSEGELSGDEEDGSAANVSQDDINDDIDYKLEVALEHPLADEKLENPIEEAIRNLPANQANQGGPDSCQQQMEGKKFGSHTLYDIFEEEDDDPLDFDEIDEEHRSKESSQEQNQQDQQGGGAPNKRDKQGDDEPVEVDIEMESEDTEETSVPRDELSERSKAAKRTRAETDEQKSEAKRRRTIAASVDDGGKDDKQEAPEEKDGKRDTSSKLRHIEKDKSSAFELIDLASSSDEECLDESPEQVGESNLQPKEGGDQKETTSKKGANVLPDSIEMVEMVVEESKEEEGEKCDASSEDPLHRVESISSIESGELAGDVSDDDVDEEPARNLPTTYNTNLGLLKFISLQAQNNNSDNNTKNADLMKRIDTALNEKSVQEYDSVDTDRLTSLWLDCTKRTGHLVHELCQQLQIVLQPTKMSKYKGDYKTGKRLNMRKIISYIASHYRKDKIWLRRTKPNKRTYNITIAVDNSSSMSENNCRQMTYQSLALLAKSLSLIEAGSLSVVSFGDQVKCIQEFGQPYFDAMGAQWLRELRFNESRTSYKLLLKHSCESFAKQAQLTRSQLDTQSSVSQLLVILSDGRNVTSEEEEVKNYLRQLKSMGVLTLFVIIDDLKRNGGDSIVDVKRCIGLGSNIRMINYMELFPFPFYVLLRQLETMPSILGDALRQWFELVSNG